MIDKRKLDGIGKRIRGVRESKGITQTALGEKIGLQKSTISKIESGSQSHNLENIVDIANTLDVRLEYLLGLDNIPDEITEHLTAVIKLFGEITTTKAHTVKYKSIYNSEELIFQIDEDYLMLKANKSIFKLIKAIAKAENSKGKLSKNECIHRIRTAEKNLEQNRNEGEDESYFLITGKQMEQIIEKAVKTEIAVKMALKEVEPVTILDE